jgi:glycolate oxidase
MSLVAELRAILGDDLVTDGDVLQTYCRDQAPWAPAGQPQALARPRSAELVQQVVGCVSRHRVALVPRGAGTGIAGGANAVDGCVVLSLEHMNRIKTLDDVGMVAVVEPGVINGQLKTAALERGCWYPPDPSSFESSQLGGNVATNAGGLCCAKYGVTGDYVLGLEAVLADGSVLRTGCRSRRDVAGYDLKRLLVGSEGTLGVITEITFRLRRPPPPARTLIASFSTLDATAAAVLAIVHATEPLLLELMDRAAIRAVEDFAHLELDVEAGAILFAQCDATRLEEFAQMRAACENAGATLVAVAGDDEEARLLLNARRMAFPAIQRLGTVLVDDVAVPLPMLAEMLRRVEAASRENDTLVATVAHAADGNLHPVVVFDQSDENAVARANITFHRLMNDAVELGGTITGEHGVGSLKAPFLSNQIGPVAFNVMRSIKDALDPHGILNPGKVLP